MQRCKDRSAHLGSRWILLTTRLRKTGRSERSGIAVTRDADPSSGPCGWVRALLVRRVGVGPGSAGVAGVAGSVVLMGVGAGPGDEDSAVLSGEGGGMGGSKRPGSAAHRDAYPPSSPSGEMLVLRIRLTLSGVGAGSVSSVGSAGMAGSADLTGVGAGTGNEGEGVSGREGDEEATVEETEVEESVVRLGEASAVYEEASEGVACGMWVCRARDGSLCKFARSSAMSPWRSLQSFMSSPHSAQCAYRRKTPRSFHLLISSDRFPARVLSLMEKHGEWLSDVSYTIAYSLL